MKARGNCVIGFLRVGPRYLLLSDSNGKSIEKSIFCLIDFYIHASMQKKGEGKAIFDKMLKFLNIQPYQIAYDTPNSKFLSFMTKHYSLINYIKQTNNIIIYDNFFRIKNVKNIVI